MYCCHLDSLIFVNTYVSVTLTFVDNYGKSVSLTVSKRLLRNVVAHLKGEDAMCE